MALFRQYLQYGYWKVRVIQKHKLPASWRHLVPGGFVLALLLLSLLSVLSLLSAAILQGTTGPLTTGPLTTDHGPLTTDIFRAPAGLLVGILLLYGLAVLMASVLTAARTEWKLLPVLPFVFGCYHFGYGSGFVRGLWDGAVRRRGPGTGFVVMTRASKAPQQGKST
jgi:hypothetical protein